MPNDPSTVAAELIKRFRRQRPLRGGSLLVTIFGDSIMPRGGAIALGSLIRHPLASMNGWCVPQRRVSPRRGGSTAGESAI
jgi:hypothetical protein